MGLYENQRATTDDKREKALKEIETELEERVDYFRSQNRFIEAQRIEERTRYDMEMIREIGYCSGVENYSRVFYEIRQKSIRAVRLRHRNQTALILTKIHFKGMTSFPLYCCAGLR